MCTPDGAELEPEPERMSLKSSACPRPPLFRFEHEGRSGKGKSEVREVVGR